MSGIPRRLAQQLVYTSFLIQRDNLSAAFSRIGSGFTPKTVITDARHHLESIESLMQKIEKMNHLPPDAIVAKDYHHLMNKDCCGRS